ncbi:hypothetical protein D3C87_1390080 [compost metagenome]
MAFNFSLPFGKWRVGMVPLKELVNTPEVVRDAVSSSAQASIARWSKALSSTPVTVPKSVR